MHSVNISLVKLINIGVFETNKFVQYIRKHFYFNFVNFARGKTLIEKSLPFYMENIWLYNLIDVSWSDYFN